MTIEYFRNSYPVSEVNSQTPSLRIEQIEDVVRVTDLGWRLNEGDLENLSALCGPVTYKLREWEESPSSNKLFNIVEKYIDKDFPVIAIVDAITLQEYRTGRSIREEIYEIEKHAVVIVGYDNQKIYINDPWGGMAEGIDRGKFEEAWDIGLNRLVVPHLQSKLDQMPGADQ